jgi:Zn-dependent M28 family amino/carboxypeptidase
MRPYWLLTLVACASSAGATTHDDALKFADTPSSREIVARLTGAEEIAPGVRLSDRAIPARRDQARTYIASVFESIGLVPLVHAYGTGANVYAELASTTAARDMIVVGAHFDSVSRSPGANDNATGVAMVLTLAERLSLQRVRTKKVVFVLFDEEERGLVGSRAFARKLRDAGEIVDSVHTIDQMGWDGNHDRLIELERPDAGLADSYRAAVADLGVSIPIVITNVGTSDHASFRPTFPAVGITEGYRTGNTSPDYHRPTDTFDKVDFAYLASTTALVERMLETRLRP